MVQQFKVPETESEIRQLQDKLYSITKEQTETGAFRGFRGLLEIMASEMVIMTAMPIVGKAELPTISKLISNWNYPWKRRL